MPQLQEFHDFFLKLAYHSKLNQKLFDGDTLRPEVRAKLLQIADAWLAFAKLPADALVDVIATGGNINYNYTEESDIDVHLVMDMSKMPISDPDFMRDYIFDKKNLWAKSHNNRVMGYPVELFAQSSTDRLPNHQGVYSLTDDKWVAHPENLKLTYDDRNLKEKVAYERHDIDRIISRGTVEEARAKIEKLRGGRGSALATESGEFAQDNLIFKSLRNSGHLQRLSDHVKTIEDKELSL